MVYLNFALYMCYTYFEENSNKREHTNHINITLFKIFYQIYLDYPYPSKFEPNTAEYGNSKKKYA